VIVGAVVGVNFKEKLLAGSFDESVDGLEQDGLLMGW